MLTMSLQVALNDLTTFDRLSSTMDDIATLMCSCRRFEKLYSNNSGESAQALIKKLLPIYRACLKLIAEALIYVEENTGSIPPTCLGFSRLDDNLTPPPGS